MNRIVMVVCVLAGGPAFADKVYSTEKTATHDCGKEPAVQITVSGGTFTLTGTCDKVLVSGATNKVTIGSVKTLSVNGAKNTVDVDGAGRITVNGNENTVTYKKSLDAKTPVKVVSNGPKNSITQVK